MLTDAAIGVVPSFDDVEISKTGNRCYLVTQAESSRKSPICRHGNLDSKSSVFDLSFSLNDGKTTRKVICNVDILRKLIDITAKEGASLKQWLRNFIQSGNCKREPTDIEAFLSYQRRSKRSRIDDAEVLQTILLRGKLIPYDYVQTLEQNFMQEEDKAAVLETLQQKLLSECAGVCTACATMKVDQYAIFFTESEWDSFVYTFSSSFENLTLKFLIKEDGNENRIWDIALSGQSPATVYKQNK